MSKQDNTIQLLRHALRSIDVSDVKEQDMTEVEAKEYNAAISAVFPRLEKDIKKALYTQIVQNNEARDIEDLKYGQGIVNGFTILYELWKAAHVAHTERLVDKKDEFEAGIKGR